MKSVGRAVGALIARLPGRSGPATQITPREGETPPLPVLHRLAVVYLMLPVVVWLLGWFNWWLGVPATAALLAGLWRPLGGSWRVAPRPRMFVLLVVAFGWVMLTAAGGVFDGHNGDWIKHRAVFTDLARHDWPLRLPDPLAAFLSAEARAAPDVLVRYYHGYYLVPALVGLSIGTEALNWAVPLWTWGGVGLLVLLFTRDCARVGAAVVAVVVLVGFSGMDWLRVLLLSGEALPVLDPAHIETDEHLLWRIQYSANTTALMWAPQHFITAGLYAMLLLQLRRAPRFLASSGVLLATCLFWSPFVAVGLLPFIGVLLLENGLRPFLRWQNVVLAGPLAALFVYFLSSGTADIVHGWIWSKSTWGETAVWLPVFYLTEFALFALLLWRSAPHIRTDRFFLASVAALTLLPVYTYGYFNDLGMRGSLPALVILCWFCAQILADQFAALPEMMRRRPVRRGRRGRWGRRGGRGRGGRKRPALPRTGKRAKAAAEQAAGRAAAETPSRLGVAFAGVLVVCLAVGAITPLHELARGYESYKVGAIFRYEHVINSLVTTQPRPVWAQYALADVPPALAALLREQKERHPTAEWTLVSRSEFDIHQSGKMLLYTKTPCPEPELEPYVFLDVWPEDEGDLPSSRRRRGYEHFLFADIRIYTLWLGERCAFIRKLPEYDVRRVATGQVEAGKRLWVGEFATATGGTAGAAP